MSATPVPVDIPLPMPAPEPVLIAVLVGFFLMHIAFVNFMVGGTFLTLWYELKGLKEKRYDDLAYAVSSTITANKSIAVVLGVGPLLAINTLYTVYFYTANALTGIAWISIIPLVITAFLLTYAHKYLWHRMENVKAFHILLVALTSLIFLIIPLIFLTNINLMLYPQKWGGVQGFLSALTLPNVFPRYVHFLLACPAMTGLFLVWLFRRQSNDEIARTGFERAELIRKGYQWALWPTAIQFLVGPWALFTLPEVPGSTTGVLIVFGISFVVSMIMVLMMASETRRSAEQIGRSFGGICLLMLVVVLLMGGGRHMYREAAVSEHRELVHKRTQDYVASAKAARDAAPVQSPAQ